MKFNIDIDFFEDSNNCDGCITEKDFINSIKNGIVNEISDRICYDNIGKIDTEGKIQKLCEKIEKYIKDFIKKNKEDIINKVTQQVTDNINKKREIIELTPKISELNKINKDNIEYLEEMIDKAIIKKFKNS